MTEKNVQTAITKPPRALTMDSVNQTDDRLCLVFAADLFFQELRHNLQEELSTHEAHQLRVLLDKSKDILEKIKQKAISGAITIHPLLA